MAMRQQRANAQAEEFARHARHVMDGHAGHMNERIRELYRQQPGIYRDGRISAHTPAYKKARELFIKTAGMDAYLTLNAGRPLPILGSKGTPYELIKKAAFCVRRPDNGVELCAVVPGVPLWDHLLGIKMMVEHDEPRFLAIANRSTGPNLRFEPYDYNYRR
jgi:hypothetical protein